MWNEDERQVDDEAKAEDLLNRLERDAGREGFGWKAKEFSLGHVELQVAIGHPCRNVRHMGQNGGQMFWNVER